VIGLENLDQVRALARWGLGSPTGVYFSPDADWLGVTTDIGTYAFESQNFTPIQVSGGDWERLRNNLGPLYQLDYNRCGNISCPDADLLRDGEKILELRASGDFTVAFDGSLVAAELYADSVQQLWIYDLKNKEEPRQLDTQAEDAAGETIPCFHEIDELAFSPNGSILAAACQGGGIYLYQTSDGVLLNSLEAVDESQNTPTSWLRFSADGTRLVSYQFGIVQLWKLDRTGVIPEPDTRFKAPGAGDNMYAISADGRWLAVAQYYGPVQVFDLETGELAHNLLALAPRTGILDFSPSADVIANNVVTSDSQNVIQLRRIQDGRVMNTLLVPGSTDTYLYRAIFTPDGEMLLISTSEGIYAWKIPAGETGTAVEAGKITPRALEIQIHPDEKSLLVLHESGLRRYSLPGLNDEGEVRGPANAISFAVSPEGNMVVIGTDGQLQVRSYPQGKRLTAVDFPNQWVDGLRFSPDGSRLLVRLYEVNQGKYEYQLYETEKWEQIFQVPASIDLGKLQVFSPDGSILATVNGTEIVLRRTKDMRGLVALLGHSDFALNLDFSPDGSLLVSAALDGTVRIWGIP
jgi:WD40 repeat protein